MDDVDDVGAELRQLCDEFGLRCSVKVSPREALEDIPPGIDVIVTYIGDGAPPAGWAVLRAEVEDAMERRGFDVMRWLCMGGPLDGRATHCVAFATGP